MKNSFRIIFVFIFFTTYVFASEQPIYSFTSPNDSQRFSTLTNEIRCPVCQGQSIAESNAPLANDLRNKVYQLMQTNKTDEEIKSYLTQRYGDVILFKPPLKQSTWFLWSFPFLLLSFIPLFLLRKKKLRKTRL